MEQNSCKNNCLSVPETELWRSEPEENGSDLYIHTSRNECNFLCEEGKYLCDVENYISKKTSKIPGFGYCLDVNELIPNFVPGLVLHNRKALHVKNREAAEQVIRKKYPDAILKILNDNKSHKTGLSYDAIFIFEGSDEASEIYFLYDAIKGTCVYPLFDLIGEQ